eukprot:scaffold200110_cov19-Tisochrysis_lutea.AAC.1
MVGRVRPSPFQHEADNQQPAPCPFSPTSLPAEGQESHPQHQSDSNMLSSIWPWLRHIRRPARKSKSSLNLSCPQTDPQFGNKVCVFVCVCVCCVYARARHLHVSASLHDAFWYGGNIGLCPTQDDISWHVNRQRGPLNSRDGENVQHWLDVWASRGGLKTRQTLFMTSINTLKQSPPCVDLLGTRYPCP